MPTLEGKTYKVAVKVEYFSDVLCVWAWIAQRRLDELRQHFSSDLELEIHYVNVFGNTKSQIGEKWASRGGFDGFGQPVIEVAALINGVRVKSQSKLTGAGFREAQSPSEQFTPLVGFPLPPAWFLLWHFTLTSNIHIIHFFSTNWLQTLVDYLIALQYLHELNDTPHFRKESADLHS